MICPLCGKNAKQYDNDDLILVVADMPKAIDLVGYFCSGCHLNFYIPTAEIINRGPKVTNGG